MARSPADPAAVFASHMEHAKPLLAKLRADGIGHFIDGKVAPAISGETFETHSPIDNALAKVCSYFDIAQKDGATIAAGGKVYDGPGGGHYIQPILVTGVRAEMRVAQEEVFGPFLTVIPFKDEANAIEIANSVQYGLTGYVWTRDMSRALRVADALEAVRSKRA